ncbi:cytochrome b5 domain-containing protein [Ectothiorhodospira marina]|uniref:Cytochrome b5-like Heme/Steroid binding domain-containing protein n=1 Tax=Ectothiorhodospira marina TaxID=1396821 RepID=A0A1H7F380_9GAMM|nr:cytochrome b5-like heme/steroid binding domain-containing protein [Ectothiorhodospira marina]SEK20274.1 Cytochrome b5-like Heme/Steroid binding domain-containing protein [Ectothiorhodospira marina]
MPSTRRVRSTPRRPWETTAFALGALLILPLAAQADDPAPSLPVITQEELAQHDQPEDCWKAIHGKVYDISEYLPQHAGPPAMVEPWCGREATEAWETKGYGAAHSDAARTLLEDYLIGIYEGEPEATAADGQQD